MTVIVSDGGQISPSIDVTIYVRDPAIPDNTFPEFMGLPYTVTIPENIMLDEQILEVIARAGTSDDVGYNIEHGVRPETNSDRTFDLNLNRAWQLCLSGSR